ncbi:uncharacterized protein ACRADG_008526 [Cochliomyia hominivorax]
MDFILQLLNITHFGADTWQLPELNSILAAAGDTSEILTLTIFGHNHEIEPYVRVSQHNHIPKLVITQSYGDISLNHEAGLNRKIFFIAVAPLDRKDLWNHMNNAFLGIQGHVRGVFITKRPQKRDTRLDLYQHLEWCWRKGFTNALILVDNKKSHQQEFEIYNYNHFIRQKVINMTGFDKTELFPDKFRNLNKFKIRTMAQFDPPRVFERGICRGKFKKRLLGYASILFQAFIKEYNAEMDLQYFSNNRSYNILDIIQRVNNDEIDLALNPYTPFKKVHLSYPLRMMQRCVVVPYPHELSKYKFFIMPFQTKVWLSFLAAWFILSLAKLFSWIYKEKYGCESGLDVGQIFLDVWRLMMFLPSFTTCCYKDFKWFNALWFCFIAGMGFIFYNLYMASLTSYFSGLIFRPTIDTLSELIKRHFAIDVVDYEIPNILDNRDLPKDFAEHLQPRYAADLLNDILLLDTNHSYAALEDRIQFALNQQLHLLRPISQVVKECLTTMPFGFLIPPHSQYEKPLNRFILRSTSAGLIDKWMLEAIQDGYCSGIINMRKPLLKVSRPLTLQHFQFGWFVLGGGYLLGAIVFMLENLRRIFKRVKIFIIYY